MDSGVAAVAAATATATSVSVSVFWNAMKSTLGIQWTGWILAYLFQTETFYDVLGGVNFLWIASLRGSGSPSIRSTIFTILFCISRSWLLIFLAWRAHARKGDSRFDGVKDNFVVFGIYWTVQAFWVYLISLPLLFVKAMDFSSQHQAVDNASLSSLDNFALTGMATGILLEIISDIQKALWVEKGRQGGFCTVGLWSYSRHPNYAGEMLQWWSAWIVAYGTVAASSSPLPSIRKLLSLSSANTFSTIISELKGALVNPWTWWMISILSPLFTMHILLNVPGTGIAHAEGKNLKRYYESYREAYEVYRETTSPVIPMVGYKNLPMWVKRTFFFEWKKYEYSPKKNK